MLQSVFEKHIALAAVIIFAVLASVSLWVIPAIGISLTKPVDWLEAWVKLFQTVVTICVGLKIAWKIDSIVQAVGGDAPPKTTQKPG